MATSSDAPEKQGVTAAAPSDEAQHSKSEFELGHDDPSPEPLIVASIVGALIVFLVIIGAMGFYLFFEQREIDRKVYRAPHVAYEAHLEEKRTLLNDPAEQAGYYEEEADRERIAERLPIDAALELALSSVTGQSQTQPGE